MSAPGVIANVIAALILVAALIRTGRWIRDALRAPVKRELKRVRRQRDLALLILIRTHLVQEHRGRWAIASQRYLPNRMEPLDDLGAEIDALIGAGLAEPVPLDPCGRGGPPVDCDTPGRCATHGAIGSPDVVLTAAGSAALAELSEGPESEPARSIHAGDPEPEGSPARTEDTPF